LLTLQDPHGFSSWIIAAYRGTVTILTSPWAVVAILLLGLALRIVIRFCTSGSHHHWLDASSLLCMPDG